METNRKTDWQRFLPINMWCLHLSLRAHINYIVVVWTFKTGNVINLFRVTTGSIWSRGFSTCGIAVRQPRLQRCHRRPRVPLLPARAGGLRAAPPLLHISEGQLFFSLPWVPFAASKVERPVWSCVSRKAVPRLRASLGNRGAARSGGCSCLPFPSQPAAASAPGPREAAADKRLPLSCSPISYK